MARSIINLIEAVVKNHKIQLTKDGWQRVAQLEKELKSRKLKPTGAIEKLKLEENLRAKLSVADWKNIKEQIEDIVD
ncbi:MAG: hypothetical protein WCJ51_02860 [Candidatus Moraniibacteriota bacterium]